MDEVELLTKVVGLHVDSVLAQVGAEDRAQDGSGHQHRRQRHLRRVLRLTSRLAVVRKLEAGSRSPAVAVVAVSAVRRAGLGAHQADLPVLAGLSSS